VAVVQRDRAQLYLGVQGALDEQGHVDSNVPGQHKQGGRSQMRFERHIDFHVAEHLQKVAAEIDALAQKFPFELALGGTDQIVTELQRSLPEPIARKVIGHFPVDYKHDGEQEILQQAELLWREREQRQENDLVDQVVTAAKSAGQGALGVGPTLDALVQEKVRILLIAEGLTIDGSVCQSCGYLAATRFDRCPFCGAAAEQREITDRAVEKALLTSAEVETVTAAGARDRLLAAGGLGALLRY
jgi:peptide chain release factor subunit 1